MKRLLRNIYDHLPPPLKAHVRKLRYKIPITKAERWARWEYMPFATEQRRMIYMSTARFLHLNRPVTGYYMEFGSHEANTMRMAWDCFHPFLDLEYLAFDSFQGLPEITAIDRQEIWKQGKLRTEEQAFTDTCLRHGMDPTKLTTHKGFYEESLNDALREKLSAKKAAVIYVDCDLYASTVHVLEFARHFLQQGTVIVFDDWNCFWADPTKGERRAWAEFCEKYPQLKFEEFVSTGMQKAFIYTGNA